MKIQRPRTEDRGPKTEIRKRNNSVILTPGLIGGKNLIATLCLIAISISNITFAEENPFWTITKNEKGMTVKTAKIDVVIRSSDGAWEIKTLAGTSLVLDKNEKLVSVKGAEVKTAQRDVKFTLPGGKQAIIPKGRILTFIDGYLRSVK